MERCTKAVIYKNNLEYNLKQIRKYVKKDVKLCVAVKADGYGHNAVLTAQIAEEVGAEFVAVATVEEGLELRENGIKCGILLLSLCTPEEMPALFEYKITPLVFTDEYISLIGEAAKKAAAGGVEGSDGFAVHLAVDTGMGRIGCYPEEAGTEAKKILESGLKLGGMCTHFAVSDSLKESDCEYTERQFSLFKSAIENVRKEGIDPGICHCCNSAATLNNPEMHLDMVRPGIIVYGYYADEISREFLESRGISIDLKPVMTFESEICAVRNFKAGASVGYGCTWTAEHDTRIGVIPAGYADGLLRNFSTSGVKISVNGKNCPVRGRICMDQCMIELGNDDKTRRWDKAVVFGDESFGALQTADDVARLTGTISYEITCGISKRVPRVFFTSHTR